MRCIAIPHSFSAFLRTKQGARREIKRLLRVIDRAKKDAKTNKWHRFERTIGKVGDDAVSGLSWLAEFSQLKPEDLLGRNVIDLPAPNSGSNFAFAKWNSRIYFSQHHRQPDCSRPAGA